jgi:hypothetical protein
MNGSKLLVIIALLSLFALSAHSLITFLHADSMSSILESPSSLKGFEDTGEYQGEAETLIKKVREKLNSHRQRADELRNYSFWINLSITILSGLATLLATLKSPGTADNPSVIRMGRLVAVITFLIGLASWSENQLKQGYQEAIEKHIAVKELRSKFISAYKDQEDNKARLSIVRGYEQELEDL